MIDFKGTHFPKDVILFSVFSYLRYAVSYRDLEEIMEERGVNVDHGTLNRWVVKFAPLLATQAQSRKKPTAESWRVSDLLCMSNLAHASPTKEHDNDDDFQGTCRRAAERR
jgi:putative transposase